MKLKKAQREFVLQLVAEGLETDEINARAKQFKPKFKVTRQQVDFYRKSRKINLNEIKQTAEMAALTTGLALKEARVDVLQKLADAMIADLMPVIAADSKLWTPMKKTVGMVAFEYKEFNRAEIDALRGVLDDIASELGARAPGVQVNNTYNFDVEQWKKDRADRLKNVQELEE